MPKISIICTVKNGEATIKDTIESVLAQTMRVWEFIIVDDGSDDQTLNIMQEYQRKDNRIKVIATSGIGRGKALNLSVDNAKGDYIINIDADDLMHPQKLEVQYNIMKVNQKYFLLSTNSHIIYTEDTIDWEEINAKNIKIQDVTRKNLIKNQVNHSSVMMRKDILVELGKYSEDRRSQFDYELWLRAGYMGYKIGKINRQLVAKRIHSEQSFESKRLGHLSRSIKLQTSFILKSKKVYLLVFPIGRIIMGILPFKARQKFNKIIKM